PPRRFRPPARASRRRETRAGQAGQLCCRPSLQPASGGGPPPQRQESVDILGPCILQRISARKSRARRPDGGREPDGPRRHGSGDATAEVRRGRFAAPVLGLIWQANPELVLVVGTGLTRNE